MKIEELMIGDWVRINDPNGPFVSRVYGLLLEPSAVYAKEPDLTVAYPYDEDCVSPIPLTSDILEKNGFGYVEKDTLMGITHFYLGKPYYCENMNLHIGGDDNGVFWLNYLRNDIWSILYVHQLQHALRICGIEKEINMN